MKKLIIFPTILISTIFSNVAFADIIIPGQNCHNYDKECYNKCEIETKKNSKYFYAGECIEKCCIKDKKYCTNEECDCMQKNHMWSMCKFDISCKWDCTNGEKSSSIEKNKLKSKNNEVKNHIKKPQVYFNFNKFIYKLIFIFLIFGIIGIFIYKRKRNKKG